jgi:hypothetical protein
MSEPWNQEFADEGLCPYCGTINWDRELDFDWDNGRQWCECTMCGSGWWEVLTPTPQGYLQQGTRTTDSSNRENGGNDGNG